MLTARKASAFSLRSGLKLTSSRKPCVAGAINGTPDWQLTPVMRARLAPVPLVALQARGVTLDDSDD